MRTPMSEPLFDRQRTALADLLRLLRERRRAEAEVLAPLEQARRDAQAEGQKLLQQLAAGREQEITSLGAAFDQEEQELEERLDTRLETGQKAHARTMRQLVGEIEAEREHLRSE